MMFIKTGASIQEIDTVTLLGVEVKIPDAPKYHFSQEGGTG